MAALAVMDPAPLRVLFSTVPGWLALGLIGLLEAVGFYLIRRIVRIDV
jgi:Flp pilus assembly protein TadB